MGFSDVPSDLLRAIAERRGLVAFVVGAGCSLESPTDLLLSAAYSLSAFELLKRNGVLEDGDCDPADLSEVAILGQACGDTEAISYNGGIRCFLDDATYRGDANVPGSWRADCAAHGGLASTAPGVTKLKVNSAQSVVVGLCQTFVVGERLTGPGAGTDFARTGQRTPIVP